MWIHENENWTHFIWDENFINNTLIDVTYKQGLLLGRMQDLGFELKLEATLSNITEDVIKSSAIEGEELDMNEVRSSVAEKLGLSMENPPKASRNVEGIVEIMIDATQNYNIPLTQARLFSWHAGLFPTGYSGIRRIIVGNWRSEISGVMQVISGAIGKEKVHFEAIAATQINTEMEKFLIWFENQDSALNFIIKSAIAHLWFLTIHPFEDGNGRIARAISDMLLARADNTNYRFYSMSNQIEKERKEYYIALERQQRGNLDITPWLKWFIECFASAICNANNAVDIVMFRSHLWIELGKYSINERQRFIINKMTQNFKGFMTTSKYAKLAHCSQDTALRDIRNLLSYEILRLNDGGGRSTSYRLINSEELEAIRSQRD